MTRVIETSLIDIYTKFYNNLTVSMSISDISQNLQIIRLLRQPLFERFYRIFWA